RFTPLTQAAYMALEDADHGPALERFREYLHLLGRLQLDARWQGKVDLSGVVQQTLLEAHQAWEQLRHWDEDRQAAWLRRALAHNLTDECASSARPGATLAWSTHSIRRWRNRRPGSNPGWRTTPRLPASAP